MTKTKAALAAIAQHKDRPARSIARAAMDANPGLWSTMEAARTSIRRALGTKDSNGKLHPCNVGRMPRAAGAGQLPPKYEMPESSAEEWKPVPLGGSSIAVMSDFQIPFHDIPAIRAAAAWLKRRKPDVLLINGDLIDFQTISRFECNPAFRDLPGDIGKTTQMLGWLRGQFPKARIVWKLGNHEERWEKHLWQSPLNGIPDFELSRVLKCEQLGVEVVGNRLPVMAGRLPILHGHEFQMGMAVSVNPARTTFLRTSHIAMIGHNHQTSEHTQTDMWRKTLTVWSTGCLCGLWPNFARVNRWNHGFAHIEISGDDFEVTNKRIQEGRVL